ncbi:MAG: asparagine--tRNA ligase [Saprospiraceae bacterium]|nr:asparagine--tRNA ligase [Saprospiraceae bacterium]
MHQYISDFANYAGKEVTVKGWIANIRKSKTNLFFSFRDGTGFVQCVASLEALGDEMFEQAKNLTLESSVAFTGNVVQDERQEGGFEVQVSSMKIYHIADGFPLAQREKDLGVKYLEDNRHLWLRKKRQWAIMRVRNQIIMGIHEFFQNEDFVQMDAPLLTGSACEGTTDLFETEFFGQPAFLSQSGQLYAEAMAMAQGKVYTFGPTFRAEKSDTPRHLAEFWMIEPEMAFYENEDNMDLIERFVKHVIGRILNRCQQELKVLERDFSKLQMVVDKTFPRITHAEAVEILTGRQEVNGRNAIQIQEQDLEEAKQRIEECKKEISERETAIKAGMKKGARKFNEAKIIALRGEIENLEHKVRNIPQWIESAKNFQHGEDFGGSDETLLTRVFDAPVMVYNWPAKIKSFYMKEVDGNPDLVKGVDLLAPEGFGEVIGGSERETDINVLIRKIKEHELDQNDFEWYLDLRRYGSVPHSGFGLGLERLVRWICNLKHVRETIPLARRYGRITP